MDLQYNWGKKYCKGLKAMNENQQISIKDLVLLFWNHIIMLVIMLVVGAVSAYAYTTFAIAPQYSSHISMYVQTYTSISNDNELAYNDISKSKQLIVIDSPPINVVSDTLNLSPHVAGILSIVRCGYTTQDDIKELMTKTEMAHMNILGFVLTRVKRKNSSHYHKHYGKYHYYKDYGYGYGEQPKSENKKADKKEKKADKKK